MNLALVVTTFAVIIPAELPDKTFISAIVLSSRYRPLPVWIGASSGLVLQAAIGVIAGRLLALLPHRAVEAIVTALFCAGAVYLLLVPEKVVVDEGVEIAEAEERVIDNEGAREPDENEEKEMDRPEVIVPVGLSSVRIALTTFGVVALAEFGDLTQVVTANLARYRDPLSVFVGASLAFICISALGVAMGRTLTRLVPLALIRKISGLVLLALGVASAVGLATS